MKLTKCKFIKILYGFEWYREYAKLVIFLLFWLTRVVIGHLLLLLDVKRDLCQDNVLYLKVFLGP